MQGTPYTKADEAAIAAEIAEGRRSQGTMTMAAICAMWRNDARRLRAEAGALPAGTVNIQTKIAAAFQLERCAEELALHLHTGADDMERHLPGYAGLMAKVTGKSGR